MKKRYLLLPFILLSIILLIIDINKEKISEKEIIENNIEIYYPYFNIKKNDNTIIKYINNYLIDYYFYEKESLSIFYEYQKKYGEYTINFYITSVLNNKENNDYITIYVNLNDDKVIKITNDGKRLVKK